MKNLKKITALTLCAVLVFTLFACGKKETTSGEAEPVKWDFCVINSLTHPSSVLCQQFADEVYEKTAYEANGGGLLFRILAFEDTHYRDLNGCTILGFCGNKIFILDPHYDEQYASDSEEYTQCKEIVTSLKKSFISYIKDAGTVE